MRNLALLCVCLTLSCCTTEGQREQNDKAQAAIDQVTYDNQCRKAGLSNDTPEYRQCMDKLARNDSGN